MGGEKDEREKQQRAAGAKLPWPGIFARKKKKNKVRPGGKLTQLKFAWKSRVGSGFEHSSGPGKVGRFRV